MFASFKPSFYFAVCAAFVLFLPSCGDPVVNVNSSAAPTYGQENAEWSLRPTLAPPSEIASLPIREDDEFKFRSIEIQPERGKSSLASLSPNTFAAIQEQAAVQNMQKERMVKDLARHLFRGAKERAAGIQSILIEKKLLAEDGGASPLDLASDEFVLDIVRDRIEGNAIKEIQQMISKQGSIEDMRALVEERKEFIDGGGLEAFARENLSRDYILASIRDSSASPMNPKGYYSGKELYAVNPEVGSGISILDPFEVKRTYPAEIMYNSFSVMKRATMEEGDVYYQGTIDNLKRHGTMAIGVNMYQNQDILGVIKLARYIKDRGMDIYVLGYCSQACSNYLLPAAKNIHIGPYGSVLYGGNVHSFMKDDMEQFFNGAIDKIKESHESNIKSKGVPDYFYEKFSEKMENQFPVYLMETGEEASFSKLHEALIRLRREQGQQSVSVASLDESGFMDFFSDFDEHDWSVVSDFILSSEMSERTAGSRKLIFNHISHNSFVEGDFFSHVVDAFDSVEKRSRYSYTEFLNLSVDLLKYPLWLYDMFPFERRLARGLPEDRRFEFLIPSVEMLRSVGLNIISGENHVGKLSSSFVSRGKYLELNAEGIENCKFFTGGLGRPYGFRTLRDCAKAK